MTFAAGCPWAFRADGSNKPSQDALTDAITKAKAADVVIFVGGITARLEGEEMSRDNAFDGFEGGDRTKIELPSVQTDLLKALADTGKPVILVNCSGSPMALPWEAKHLPAILQAWYPGEQGGRAVGEIMFGDVNPSGHLPLTFYAATADLPGFTDYSMSNRTYRYFNGKPEFAFGHGLSYTKFDFKNNKLESKKILADGTAKVTFTVKNTGKLAGDEVAQVYYRHVNPAVPQPKLALCGFTRVHLKRGESGNVTVEIPVARLRYWSTQEKQYAVESGDYRLIDRVEIRGRSIGRRDSKLPYVGGINPYLKDLFTRLPAALITQIQDFTPAAWASANNNSSQVRFMAPCSPFSPSPRSVDFRPRRRAPEVQGSSCVQCADGIAIRGERRAPEISSMTFQREHVLPAFRVPQFQSFLAVAAGGQPLSVWRKGHRFNANQIAAEGCRYTQGCRVPHAGKAQTAGRREKLSVGRETGSGSFQNIQIQVRLAFDSEISEHRISACSGLIYAGVPMN